MWEWNHQEGWAPKNRCFQTVVIEETLENPLDRKDIKPVSPQGNLGLLIRRAELLEKTLMLWKTEGRKRGWLRIRWLDDITDSVDMTLSNSRRWWRTRKPGLLQFTGLQKVRHDLVTEWFIYLEAPGLRCGTWIVLAATYEHLVEVCGI